MLNQRGKKSNLSTKHKIRPNSKERIDLDIRRILGVETVRVAFLSTHFSNFVCPFFQLSVQYAFAFPITLEQFLNDLLIPVFRFVANFQWVLRQMLFSYIFAPSPHEEWWNLGRVLEATLLIRCGSAHEAFDFIVFPFSCRPEVPNKTANEVLSSCGYSTLLKDVHSATWTYHKTLIKRILGRKLLGIITRPSGYFS